MTNDDKQETVPFTAQESVLELNEQVLEGVVGAGLVNSVMSCFGCGAPKVEKTANPSGVVASWGPYDKDTINSAMLHSRQFNANLPADATHHYIPWNEDGTAVVKRVPIRRP